MMALPPVSVTLCGEGAASPFLPDGQSIDGKASSGRRINALIVLPIALYVNGVYENLSVFILLLFVMLHLSLPCLGKRGGICVYENHSISPLQSSECGLHCRIYS